MDKPSPFQSMKNAKENPVIFFDGVCNLCNGFVQFVIKRDKGLRFKFASLQSEHALDIPVFSKSSKETNDPSTVVLRHKGVFYYKSTAILEMARILGFPFSLIYIFRFFPKSIRDAIYDRVASNRYKWFGKKDSCMMPTPDLKGRFL